MKTKQLNFPNKVIIKTILCLTMGFTTLGCKSQINLLTNYEKLTPSHEIIDERFKKCIDIMLADPAYKNWKEDNRKWVIASAKKDGNDIIIRMIPSIRASHFIPKKLINNYSAYIMYDDLLVIYWGDANLFFKTNGNKKNMALLDVWPKPKVEKNEDDDIQIVDLTTYEYYGSEFLIHNNEVKLIETNYFGKPIVE